MIFILCLTTRYLHQPMFSAFIINYTPLIILSIVIIFSVFKLIKMSSLGHNDRNAGVFFRSFIPHNAAEIRNAGDKRIQSFLKKNNETNYILYVAIVLVVGVYMFMKNIQ